MPVERFPLVGSIVNRNSNPSAFVSSDQLFVDCYPEIVKNPITGKITPYLYKRPGTTTTVNNVSTAATAASLGFTMVSGGSYSTAVFSFRSPPSGGVATTSFVFRNNGSSVGSSGVLSQNCLTLSEAQISNTTYVVGTFQTTSSGVQAWYDTLSGSAWTRVSSLPSSNVGSPLVQMDGYLFFIDSNNGKIWNSDLNSIDNWTGTSFLAAQSMPDGGVWLVKYRTVIVALGKFSIEFFNNVGNQFGSPLDPMKGQTRKVGAFKQSFLAGQQTTDTRPVISVLDNVYWIGITPDSLNLGIYRLNGYEPVKISTPAIDKLLRDFASQNSASLLLDMIGAFRAHGMNHVAVRIGNAVWSYCIETNVWWQNTMISSFGSSQMSILGEHLVGVSTSILSISTSVFTDNGSSIVLKVRMQNDDLGTSRRKFYKRFRVIGDSQTSTSNVSVSYSDDDYATFSAARTIDMSSSVQRDAGLTRLGESRRRAWQLTHSDPTPLRLDAVEIEYVLGP